MLVSPHLLEHYSVSSKSKNDKTNSESFQDELRIWENAISKFKLKKSVSYKIDNQYQKLPEKLPEKIVI